MIFLPGKPFTTITADGVKEGFGNKFWIPRMSGLASNKPRRAGPGPTGGYHREGKACHVRGLPNERKLVARSYGFKV